MKGIEGVYRRLSSVSILRRLVEMILKEYQGCKVGKAKTVNLRTATTQVYTLVVGVVNWVLILLVF